MIRKKRLKMPSKICGGGKYTETFKSGVFGTCDNGPQETGLFTQEYIQEFHKKHGNYPQLQRDHPMNDIVRVGDLTTTLHAGSSSCAFHSQAFEDVKVHTIPLYDWRGTINEWWRQCWMYEGCVKKAYCNLSHVAAGRLAAGGRDITCEKAPFCMILFHTVTSLKKGKVYHPPSKTWRRIRRFALPKIRMDVVKKGLTLLRAKYDDGCPNVFTVSYTHLTLPTKRIV